MQSKYRKMNLLQLILLVLMTLVIRTSEGSRFWSNETMMGAVSCCECVPFFACKNGNNIDADLLQEVFPDHKKGSINVEKCPVINDVCCLSSTNLPESCSSFTSPIIPSISRESNMHCNCFHWQTCPLDLITTDGQGLKSQLLSKIGLKSHSKCSRPTEVCCALDEGDVAPLALADTPILNSRIGSEMDDEVDCPCTPHKECSTFVPTEDGAGVLKPRIRSNSSLNHDECEDPADVKCCPDMTSTSGHNGPGNSGASHIITRFNSFPFCLITISYFAGSVLSFE